jgi:Ca2+/Na+ antiporter
MEIVWAAAQFIAGFIFLVGGAELLIRGASRIALRLGI